MNTSFFKKNGDGTVNGERRTTARKFRKSSRTSKKSRWVSRILQKTIKRKKVWSPSDVMVWVACMSECRVLLHRLNTREGRPSCCRASLLLAWKSIYFKPPRPSALLRKFKTEEEKKGVKTTPHVLLRWVNWRCSVSMAALPQYNEKYDYITLNIFFHHLLHYHWTN